MAEKTHQTLSVTVDTAGFRARELRKIRQGLEKMHLAVRDAEIKARYDDLKPKMTQTDAIAQLAGEYSLSESHIQGIIWPR